MVFLHIPIRWSEYMRTVVYVQILVEPNFFEIYLLAQISGVYGLQKINTTYFACLCDRVE